MLHFHDLEGGGIAEDKRMINAKSPWTLAHFAMNVLQGFYNNPAVPPSMKSKLKTAMMMKPSLKKKLKGGLAGVSKASGFIQRMMAENKKKHGTYKKPTDPAHPDSTMKDWVPFDYKKLANKDQGGEGEADYGASPFIQKYFKNGTVPFTKGNTAKETAKQKEARLTMIAKRLLKLAKRLAQEQPKNTEVQEQIQEAREAVEEKREEPAPVETPKELLEHFGNVSMGEPPAGLEVKPKEKSAEEATPADTVPKKRTVIKLKRKVVVEPEPEEAPKNELVSTEPEAEPEPEPEPEVQNGASRFLFVAPSRVSEEYVHRGIDAHKRLIKKIKDMKANQPSYVLQWATWQLFNYKTFVEGADNRGWLTESHWLPPDDKHRRALGGWDYGSGKLNTWMKPLDIPEERVNPVSFLKLLKSLKERVIAFRDKTPDAMRDGAFSRVVATAGKNGDYPLYPEKLSGADGKYPQGASFKTPEIKAFYSEYWNLKEDLDRYCIISNIFVSSLERGSEEDFIKQSELLQNDVIRDLDELISSLEKVQTKEAIRTRMNALEEWSKFQLSWREKWLDTRELPTDVYVPHTPDEIGYVINHTDEQGERSSLKKYRMEKQKEADAKRPPPKAEKVKVRSGQSGSVREANIKKILEKTPKASLAKIAEELKELGDTGAGGKALSIGTLSPIVKSVKAGLSGSGIPRMCGV